VYARNILIQSDSFIYHEPILLPPEGPEKILKNHKKKSAPSGDDNNSVLKVYPNPAHDFLIAEYLIIGGTNNSIDIVDVTGKICRSYILKDLQNQLVIETGDLKTGIYYVRLIVDGKVSKSSKLSIVKN